MAVYSAPALILYNGQPVLQATRVDHTIDTGNKDVITMLLGRAGFTAGPLSATLSISNAVPADGPEFDWYAIAAAQVEIALDFKMGGRVVSMRGDIRSVKSSSQAEGTPNGIDFEYSATILAIA